MRSFFLKASMALIGCLAFLSGSQQAHAQTIFHDDYTSWEWHFPIEGEQPNVVNTNFARYQRTNATTWEGNTPDDALTYAHVGRHAGVESPLGQFVETKAPGGANSQTSWFLPYEMDLTNSTDKLKLTFTFRKPAPATPRSYNNLVFGFTGASDDPDYGEGHLDTFFRFDNNARVIPHVPGENVDLQKSTLLLGEHVSAHFFNTVSIEYNPLNVGTQPWSFQWNNDPMTPFPKSGYTSYEALTQITGVGFGNYESNKGFDRTMWMRDFKFEVIPQEVDPGIDGDLDGDGFVGQTDLNLILGSWGQDVPPGNALADADGSGSIGQGDLNLVLGGWGQGNPPIDAVPEPASLLLMGLAGIGLVALRVRRRGAVSGHH